MKTGEVDLDGLRKANLTVTIEGLNRELLQAISDAAALCVADAVLKQFPLDEILDLVVQHMGERLADRGVDTARLLKYAKRKGEKLAVEQMSERVAAAVAEEINDWFPVEAPPGAAEGTGEGGA